MFQKELRHMCTERKLPYNSGIGHGHLDCSVCLIIIRVLHDENVSHLIYYFQNRFLVKQNFSHHFINLPFADWQMDFSFIFKF